MASQELQSFLLGVSLCNISKGQASDTVRIFVINR